jgi:maltose/maltodextrin transport system permease protein
VGPARLHAVPAAGRGVSISLRPGNFATGSLIPSTISFEHWKLALGIPVTQADGTACSRRFPVLLWLWNSIKIATISALLIVAISTTAAYAFARMKFARKQFILNSMLLLQMFPVAVALVAIYAIFEGIGTQVPWLGIETHAGADRGLPGRRGHAHLDHQGLLRDHPARDRRERQGRRRHALAGLPPRAAADGRAHPDGGLRAGLHRHHHRVPVASILLREEPNLTLAVGSKFYLYEQKYLWGDFAAAAVLSGLPITLVFLLAQKWIVSGLTAGGVKG